jgi:hypothetical protein
VLAAAATVLARYELPVEVRVVDALPRTPSGKVDLAEVRALLTDPSGVHRPSGGAGSWTFGVEPLPQATAVAPLLRRVAGLVLALEQADPAVDRLVAARRRHGTARDGARHGPAARG